MYYRGGLRASRPSRRYCCAWAAALDQERLVEEGLGALVADCKRVAVDDDGSAGVALWNCGFAKFGALLLEAPPVEE